MARQLRGLFGPISGRISNLNGYVLYDKPCLRAVPATRLDAKSSQQVANRLIFAAVAAFLNQIYFDLVKPLLHLSQGVASSYFKFFKLNYSVFNAAGLASPAGLIISSGPLLAVLNFQFVSISGRDFYNFEWVNNANSSNGFDNDLMYALFYNHTLRSIQLLDTHPLRFLEAVQQRMPSDWTLSHDLYAYVSFIKFNGLQTSDNETVNF